jgi:hypothetical protein
MADMKYEVMVPPEIDQRLAARANACGCDVIQMIEVAIVQLVDEAVTEPAWSPEMQTRRSALIDKDIAGTITMIERMELANLDRLGNAYYDRVAAPPMDGARALHQKLTEIRGHQ